MQDEMKPQVQQPQVDNSEGQMARADLYRGAKNAMKLFQMVQDGQQLEGWVQAKITKAADYLDSVYHYMEYQAKFGQGGVAISLDDITSDAAVSSKQGAVSEEDDEKEIKESMNYEQKLQALLEGAKKKMKPTMKDEKVKEGKTEVQYDKDGKRTGVKHTSTHEYTDEPHTEPKSQVKAKSAAEKAGEKAADKQQAKDSKDYEKKNPGSVTRYKDGKKVSENTKRNLPEMDSSDAASDNRENLAKQIYSLAMHIHTGDKMYAYDSPEDNARLKKLQAEFARLHPNEDPMKIGREVAMSAPKKQLAPKSQSTPGIVGQVAGKVKKLFQSNNIQSEAKKAESDDEANRKKEEKKKKIAKIMDEAKGKKPDANKDGIPDYAQDGKGAKDLGKGKGGAPKKGVNPFAKKDEKVKESDTRAPTKSKERTDTLPSGAKVKTTTYQGWQSQAADKAADKAKKDSMKESVTESADLMRMRQLMKRLNG
jgi:hypothetical protein